MRLAIFPLLVSKALHLPRTSEAKSYEVLHLSCPVAQNHLSKPQDLTRQNRAFLSKSAPRPLNMSDSCVSCTAPATRHASLQILFKCTTSANILETATKPSCLARLSKAHNPLHLLQEMTLQRPKMVQAYAAFTIFNWKCASSHIAEHFVSI